jgi:hypothetical protein
LGFVLLGHFSRKDRVALTPDWARGRWVITSQTGIAHVVFPTVWPETLTEPTFCLSEERCLTCRRSHLEFMVVDWDLEKVIVAYPQGNDTGRIVLREERP